MCTLRIYGPDLDVDRLLSSTGFRPSSIFRKGEPRRKSKPDGEVLKDSGICVTVSEAEWSELGRQAGDAIGFLRNHERELRGVAAIPGLSWFVLDFPSDLRIGRNDIASQTDCFPAELLLLAGTIGLGIELTTYG